MACAACGAESSPDAKGPCSRCGATLVAPDALTSFRGGELTRGAATMPLGDTPASFTSGLLTPGAAFGERYHVIRLLGAGGMGAVYQAWDNELGVAVALKVIRPEVMVDAEGARDLQRRFKRELLLARRISRGRISGAA
jgi:hypothetical protein